jgi:hypothetical protein
MNSTINLTSSDEKLIGNSIENFTENGSLVVINNH